MDGAPESAMRRAESIGEGLPRNEDALAVPELFNRAGGRAAERHPRLTSLKEQRIAPKADSPYGGTRECRALDHSNCWAR